VREDLQPGTKFGDYEIVAELGRGGMGRVYRARNLTLERDVALKLVSEQLAADDAFLHRFLKEARAVARLNHRNIVQIYEFGQVEATAYLAMEFVNGQSLGSVLRQRGACSEGEAIGFIRQACLALGVAHAAGLVHRDVKPDNFILRGDGVLKLVDLGLAKTVTGEATVTQTGMVAGTPSYISPEQIACLKDIDGRADIYSLGATLFHLLIGHPPYEGSSPMVVIAKQLHDPLPDPHALVPALSAGVCDVIRTMMARDRDDRYPDMAAVDAALAALQPAAAKQSVAAFAAEPTLVSPREPAAGASTATPHVWDSAVLARVENALAAAIGPLARVLVRQAAQGSATLDDLIDRLAGQIPSEARRKGFVVEARRVAVADQEPPSRLTAPGGASDPGSLSQTPKTPPGDVAWDPAALRAIETKLAAEIGPLARVLVKKATRRATNWDDLVAALAANLPGASAQAAFRDEAGKLTGP
jgi:eukaryotic-like serine/threonine-protein kinase